MCRSADRPRRACACVPLPPEKERPMNVLVVGLLCILAYLVFMFWWLRLDERKDR
jgi:hypothetical protein